MEKEELVIRISVPEENWKRYGDVSAIIEGKCGGTYTWEEFMKSLKLYFEQLPRQEICPRCKKEI